MGTTIHTLKQRAYHELQEYLVIVLYLWMVFGLLLLYKSVILAENHISFAAKDIALINALVLGKFILIAGALHLGDQVDDAPLIYPTLLKSALFSVCWQVARFSKTPPLVSIMASHSWRALLTLVGVR